MIDKNKYQNKYRILSARLKGYDYSRDGYYFVTICTNNRIECLSRVVADDDGSARVVLSKIGKIVEHELFQTEKIRENVFIDTFQIMPNHLHVIFKIDNISICRDAWHASLIPVSRASLLKQQNIGNPDAFGFKRDARGASLPDWHKYKNMFGPQSQNLASIVRGFKSAVQSCVNKNALRIDAHIATALWQTGFYDCIIRNENALEKIREYIRVNPAKWKFDRNRSEGVWY